MLFHQALMEADRGKKPAAILIAEKALSTGAFPEADQTRKLLETLRR
jgi:hypothetical protein